MKISLNWLRELVDVAPADVDKLAERLTLSGLEVEAIERRGEGLSGVVVGRIASSKPHPKADKLSVTEVEAGGPARQIVCGAKNYKVGDLVPVALPGAELPGGLRIAEAELRGVKSFGMLCSQRELGLSDAHEGLWILPAGTPGEKLTDVLPLVDTVVSLNVTANRGDCLSHLGVSREVAALTGVARRAPDLTHATLSVQHRLGKPRLDVEAGRCGLLSMLPAQSLADLAGPSPFWMQARLLACAVRPLGLAIDITNYVMLELGQPLHAYDLDKLKTGIAVRLARAGEKLETLDGEQRDLTPDDLLICDGDQPIGLAGVMGGASTAVGAGTRRLYLEAASFGPGGVRRTAKRHGLPSEASHRFERGVDPRLPGRALARAAALLQACAPGTQVGAVESVEQAAFQPRRVKLAFSRVADLLGLALDSDVIAGKLAALDLSVVERSAAGATFEIPSHRPDLTESVDLVAEVGRLVGVDQIPARAPRHGLAPPVTSPLEHLRSEVRGELLGAGFSEVVQYSFFSGALADAFAEPGSAAVALVNPLKSEQAAMRRSLLPSLCDTAGRNLAHLTRDAGVAPSVRLFEMASTYRWPRQGESPEGPAVEVPHLGIVWHGPRAPLSWGNPRDLADFYDLRGLLERLFERARRPLRLVPAERPMLHPRSSAEVFSGGRRVGFVGEIHPGLAKSFDLPKQLLLAELSLSALLEVKPVARQPRVPKFPAVLRDIALVLRVEVAAESVAACLREAGGPLLEAVALFDVYQGAPLAAGEKSLAYSLRFRSEERTLTDEETGSLHAAMVKAVETKLGARLRA